MRRYGNLRVGSVFGIFQPETAVSVFGFQKIYMYTCFFGKESENRFLKKRFLKKRFLLIQNKIKS